MKKGAQPGNRNGAGHHEWSDAIRKEIVGRKRLAKLARSLVDKAEGGDMSAMREVGDRLDGKPSQSMELTGKDGGAIEYLELTDTERASRAISLLDAARERRTGSATDSGKGLDALTGSADQSTKH